MPATPHDALRAWFLGPRAENADLFERLVTEAVRDHVFWRRNYHPEDGAAIRETDKRSPGYEDAVGTLTQELMGLLAELKRDVPFFSGRYKGHMIFEQTIAAQVGYFAAMLYNPNNVTTEVAPVTTRLELEVAAQLARMIGYQPSRSWGHLCSGGTVANFEALWIARNIRYLPVAAALASRELGLDVEVRLPGGSSAPVRTLGLFDLLGIRPDDALDLWDALRAAVPPAEWRTRVERHSLAWAGYQEYSRQLGRNFGDLLPDGVVLVAATAHYSWEKVIRSLGIGSRQLVYVPVDARFRLDPGALWQGLCTLHQRRAPVIACVSVCGTTEESAVDQLDLVLQVRERAERELGMGFHLHSDACYGGYAAAVTRRADGTRRDAAAIRASTGSAWPDDDWLRAMTALERADSVTIDPHKLGYVPYPAGAILLRDRRARELVAVDPPYLTPSAERGDDDRFIGRFIFEGSKPGAAAAAVWLSHKVLPLDERGYGFLIERTVIGAHQLHAALGSAGVDPFRVVRLPLPDINVVCFLMHHANVGGLDDLNRFNEGVYRQLSLNRPQGPPEYIITRTRLTSPHYDGAIEPILRDVGGVSRDAWRDDPGGLVVLRATVMDPFLADRRGGTDHIAGFVAALHRAAHAALGPTSLSGW
ncbi:MAG: pyridoxal-dependent decarboxylase [Gemmatimonadales bacterium]|nr:pyridoxal-dependent decarboxylase [Gemmatimonadales bacterium]